MGVEPIGAARPKIPAEIVSSLRPSAARSAPRGRRRLSGVVPIIHLYMARRLVGPFAVILALMLVTLSLENVSRLLLMVKDVGRPIGLIGRFMLFLLPEYAAIGLLVALFLAVALAIRSAALAGEWQVFASVGVPPRRLLLVPMLLACLCAASQLGIRLHLQPAGETRLDSLSLDIARGLYGFGGAAGDVVPIGQLHAYASVAARDPETGEMRGIFLNKDGVAFTARSGRMSLDPAGLVRLELRDGTAVATIHQERRRIDFRSWSLALPMNAAPSGPRSPSERLDRLGLARLLGQVGQEAGGATHPALAALAARASYAAFSLLIPLLAGALGLPTLRGRGSLGIAAGLLLVVAFVRSTAWIEAGFTAHPLAAAGLHLLAWTGLAFFLWRREQTAGPGAAEAALGGILRRATAWLRPPRPTPPVSAGPADWPLPAPARVAPPPQAKAA